MAKRLHTTKVGTLIWPHLHAPDTKFNPDGVYRTKYTPDEMAEGERLARLIDEAMDAAVEEAKQDPKNKGKKIKRADAPYTQDEETGAYTFNFKLNRVGQRKDGTKFTQQPALFDGRGGRIPSGVRIGGGSKGCISFEIAPFYTALVGAGVTLRLKAVQIRQLEQLGGTAASFGFETEEDGFDASTLEPDTMAEAESPSWDTDEAAAETDVQDAADF